MDVIYYILRYIYLHVKILSMKFMHYTKLNIQDQSSQSLKYFATCFITALLNILGFSFHTSRNIDG